MMSIVIIGCDPGDSTGIAVIVDKSTKSVPTLFYACQTKPDDALTMVELLLPRYSTSTVTIACERYVSMQTRGKGRTHQPTAQRVIGACEHIAQQHGCQFVLQGPADAWTIASNDLLRKLHMYQTNTNVKQRDAYDANMAVRHALLYLAHAYASRFDALLKSVNWSVSDVC